MILIKIRFYIFEFTNEESLLILLSAIQFREPGTSIPIFEIVSTPMTAYDCERIEKVIEINISHQNR
jgi:hypothetical protein